MPERVLLRGGHVLSMDPDIGDVYGGDVLSRTARSQPSASGSTPGRPSVIDASDCIVMPGFIDSHRHTWETGDPRDRARRQPRRLLRPRPRPARPCVPARGRLRRQLPRLARGDRRGRDDAPRLVAHLEHAGALGRGDPRAAATPASGRCTATATRTPRSPTGGTRARSRRRRTSGACASATSRATTACSRSRWGRAARGSARPRSCGTTGSSPATSARRSASTSGWAPYAGRFSMVSQLDEMGLLGPDTTYIHCNYLSDDEFRLIAETRREGVDRTDGRDDDGARNAADREGAGARAAAEPQHRRRHDRAGRHVHADALPLRARPPARARGGLRRRATRRSRRSSRAARCSSSRRSRERGCAASRTAPARSPRASRRTW